MEEWENCKQFFTHLKKPIDFSIGLEYLRLTYWLGNQNLTLRCFLHGSSIPFRFFKKKNESIYFSHSSMNQCQLLEFINGGF